ncbi:tetratricopeptide repeat protein [Candidatus Marsarchaeota archaeon]|nr:tetratricopeptide repeat protein [Candidatus Marsarchaeota archaeon]
MSNFRSVQRSGGPQQQEDLGRSQIQITEILEAEFKALGTDTKVQRDMTERYEEYVTGMMNAVSIGLGFGEAATADKKRLAEAVRNADERELFEYISAVFQYQFKAIYKQSVLLADSVESGKFNCYSSSVLFADVLVRLGKEMNIVIVPQHVLLLGNDYAFETTAPYAGNPVLTKEQLEDRYRYTHVGGCSLLLAVAYDWCGHVYAKIGHIEDALNANNAALRIDPEFKEAWFNKGISLARLGRYKKAIAAYDNALRIDPEFGEAWGNKGSLYLRLGKYKKAIDALDNALGVDPEFKEAWFNKGILRAKLNRHSGAIAAYNRALRIDPEFKEAWFNKGISLARLGRYEKAIAAYDEALRIDPEFRGAWFNKGISLAKLGRYEKAIAAYDEALQIDPEFRKAWSNKGLALEKLGKYEEAQECFREHYQLEIEEMKLRSVMRH